MLKKLFSHTAIYGLAPQVTKVASFFSLPLITKELTDIDYGVAGILTAYTAALSVFSMIGLRVVLVNSFLNHLIFINGGGDKYMGFFLYGISYILFY
ncbi:hypothetical protein [Mangrovivirga cuniculi]|uniref:Polysaccharide biosynthesis protein C-terminal domain-containing protein n=1 Tax=Mangrovivirga cuniculi TaxID=2715131 RepID=A0A4D7JQY5_9BACT|nr:hypothetical protein [Mangrovivirga cuniculi]QCK15920.1 hypothetical protein DCC35_14815 [Mangrovivirga cuniculi]